MFKKIISSILAIGMIFGGAVLPGSANTFETVIEASAANERIYTHGDYSLIIDYSKWKDISSQVTNVDCAFSYIGNTTNDYYLTANFNIITQSGAQGITVNEAINAVLEQYDSVGYEVIGNKKMTFNGYDARKLKVNVSQGGFTMTMSQLIFIKGDMLYVLTYGAEASVYSTVEPEFENVLSTIVISDHTHKYVDRVVKPTYTAKGYTLHTCSSCGYSYKDKYTDKLNTTSIAKATVSGLKNKYYTGKAITQSPTVKLGNKTLKKGTDYTVTFKNNKAVGKATVTIKGKGNYSGTVTKTFKILPKKTTLKTAASPKKGQLKVTYSKQTNITGYQITYSTDKSFKSKASKASAKTSKTISGLKSGKTYYVKVRTYKTVNGTKYCSGYSAVKKIKVK